MSLHTIFPHRQSGLTNSRKRKLRRAANKLSRGRFHHDAGWLYGAAGMLYTYDWSRINALDDAGTERVVQLACGGLSKTGNAIDWLAEPFRR